MRPPALPAAPKVPVTILTGFLGAGKTTLLNRILRERHGERIAVIENEFGEAGVDNDLLMHSGSEQIVEMNNGCICCTVRGDLVRILGELRERLASNPAAFDHLLATAVNQQIVVDASLAELIFDHRDALAVALVQDAVQQCRLSCTEKSGEDRDRNLRRRRQCGQSHRKRCVVPTDPMAKRFAASCSADVKPLAIKMCSAASSHCS